MTLLRNEHHKGFIRWYRETKSRFKDLEYGFCSPLTQDQNRRSLDINFQPTRISSSMRPVYSLMNRIKECKQNNENAQSHQKSNRANC